MSFGPVVPAEVAFDTDGTPRSPAFGDVYHARAGAIAQAQHVFLRGNGLPERWQGRRRFTVLETGFGLGHNFLATWQAWRESPKRPDRLEVVSIEKHPLRREDLARVHAGRHAPALQALADALLAAWPPLTPDIHVLDFDGGRVRLLLVLADVAQALPELVVSADAFFLDGFAPPRNPRMWDPRVLARLTRLAAPGATVATWSAARELRDALVAAGFEVVHAPGFAAKKDMTVGRFAPRHAAMPPPGRRAWPAQRVAVVGAGLAGAGAARALAAEGLHVEIFEADSGPARQASGNPAALFHGIVHGADGPHARWLRACALRTRQVLEPMVADARIDGTLGLLRAENALALPAMRALLQQQGLPPDWVEAVAAERGPAWWYPGGGWADPAAVVRAWLAQAGAVLHCGAAVAALRPIGADGWQLLDPTGAVRAEADAVVLANASGAPRLLGHDAWPMRRTRGQISLLAGAGHEIPLPLADAGYALQLRDRRLLFGATSQPGDEDAACRDSDHAQNLDTLERLTGWRAPAGVALEGRVGWRLQTPDRMPLIGPVPVPRGASGPVQPRLIERRPGLYSAIAYGSRGLTQAALAGEVLAAWLVGSAMPVPVRLLDAVDGARFDARLNRSSAS
jgi:tRNA 5-methylaminomethyl-2-thiouridine biosynthesis bifunctional protein